MNSVVPPCVRSGVTGPNRTLSPLNPLRGTGPAVFLPLPLGEGFLPKGSLFL